MKPAQFQYLRPNTIAQAVSMLDEFGDDAKVLSGGQSLVPILNMRLSTPKYIIDIGKVQELNGIREEDGHLVIGAATKQHVALSSKIVQELCPLLIEALKQIGHPQIRHQGTIGGSVAHADPSAEIPCVLSALRGEIVILGSDEERTATPEDFFLTYMLTSLEPTELIKEIRFPIQKSNSGYAFLEKSRREGDFALVEVATTLDLDGDGNIEKVCLAVGGAGPVPVVLEEIEDELIGRQPDRQMFKDVGKLALDVLEPDSDLHGSAEYRAKLASVLIGRALEIAANRAGKGDAS